RDGHVTGVQTCALPISGPLEPPLVSGVRVVAQEGDDLGARMANAIARYVQHGPVCVVGSDSPSLPRAYLVEAFERLKEVDVVLRSEERRVGKEGRAGGG